MKYVNGELELAENEFVVPLQNFSLKYMCPACKKGEMIVNPKKINQNAIIPGQVPKLWHICIACKNELLLEGQYPRNFAIEVPMTQEQDDNTDNDTKIH